MPNDLEEMKRLGSAAINIARDVKTLIVSRLEIGAAQTTEPKEYMASGTASIVMLVLADMLSSYSENAQERMQALRDVMEESAVYILSGARLENFKVPGVEEAAANDNPAPEPEITRRTAA